MTVLLACQARTVVNRQKLRGNAHTRAGCPFPKLGGTSDSESLERVADFSFSF
jgi:hypothetical protein